MKNLTLRQLRYFDALARQGHFGRAAEVCSVTQPALSMQIRELEDLLGRPLLDRSARQLRLTGFGEVFLGRTREILRSVDGLEEMLRATGDAPAGPLRIGIIPTVAPYLLPLLIGQLSQQFPDLEPTIRETVTPRLIPELQEGRLDTAIVALPVSEPGLEEVPIFEEPFLLVRPADADARATPDRDALREMQLLLLEEGHCFRDQALSFCAPPASGPRRTMDGSSLSTLVQMVGAGLGVTLIPEMAVPVEMRAAPVAVARFRDPQPARTIGMVWRRGSLLEPQLRQIAEVVGSAAEALRAESLHALPAAAERA